MYEDNSNGFTAKGPYRNGWWTESGAWESKCLSKLRLPPPSYMTSVNKAEEHWWSSNVEVIINKLNK